jgi:transposase
MFCLTAATRIYLYRGICDMRKSFDGLCGIVRSDLEEDPLSGSLFVFVNRRRSMVKLLYWDAWSGAILPCPIGIPKTVASNAAN